MKQGYVVIDHENNVAWGDTPESAFDIYRSEFDAYRLEELVFINLGASIQFYGKLEGITLLPI